MAKGLSEQWGVGSPNAAAGSTQQRDAFTAAFNGAMQGLTGNLDYTVKNTELTKHQPLAGGRDAVYGKYNKVLGQIDPTDESKAAGAISSLLKVMKALGQKAKDVKQRTEDELAKWNDSAGDREEANDQIDELDAWGIEMIDKFLAERGLIDAEEAKRRWKEATDLLRKLRESLKPVYEEYLRQKAAKEKYEPDRSGFDGEFDPLARYEEATEAIKDLAKQIAEGLAEIADRVAEKDYVSCNDLLNGLKDILKQLQNLVEKQEALKAEYEARLPGVLKRDFEAPESKNGTPGWQLQMDIVNLEENMKAAAEGKDYETALGLLDQLEAKNQEAKMYFAELAAKKQAYDQRLDELLTRATEASSDMPERLGPHYQKVDVLFPQADEAASMERYDDAMALLGTLEVALVAFEALMTKHREEMARFEAEWPPLLESVTQTVVALPPALEGAVAVINALLKQIELASSAGNYGIALSYFAELELEHQILREKLAHYEAQKAEYEARKAEVEDELEKTRTGVPKSLQDEKGQVERSKSEADSSGAAGDFDKGQKKLDETQQKAEELDDKAAELEAKKKDYELGHKALEGRLTAMDFPADFPMLKEGGDAIVKRKAEAEAAAEAEDYDTALDALGRAAAMAEGYAKELPVYQKQEADYLAKSPPVVKQLQEAGKDLPNDEKAKAFYEGLLKGVTLMEGEAAKRDFPAALSSLSQLENGLTTLATFKEKERQKEEDYNKRSGALEGPLAEAINTKEKSDDLIGIQGRMAKKQTAAQQAAAARDFDKALELLGELEAMLEGYQTLKADIEAERKTYNDRLAKITPRLSKTEPSIPGDMAKSILNAIKKNKARMEGAAAIDDFDEALQAIDWLETSLAAYEKLSAEHEKLKSDYEKRSGALADGLAEVAKPVSHMALKMPRNKIFGKQEAMQKAAGQQDYAVAIAALDWLEPAVADYLTLQNAMENAQEEYEKRYDGLRSRLDAAADPAEYPEVEEPQGKMAADRAAMEKSADGEDYENALGQIVVLAADVAAYETLLERLFQQEQEFDSRWSTLKGPLAEAIKAKIVHEALKGMQERMGPRRDKVEEAQQNRDFAAALVALTELEAHFEGFKTLKADVEEERRTYETRHAALAQSLKIIEPPLTGDMATSILNAISHNTGRMETAAAAEDFDEALEAMDWVETSLSAYAELLENEKELEVQYKKGDDALKAKLSKMNFPVPYAILSTVGDSIIARMKKMKAEADKRDFEAAIDTLNRATAVADGYAKEAEALKKQEADYRARHAAIKPRLQAIAKAKPSDPKAQAMLKGITKGYKAMKDLAANHEYKEALSYLTQLSGTIATLEAFLAETAVDA